jgi:shikimate kinase/3-dehydroquinate synthase
MGAGKTTVGSFLAHYLKRPLVDLDEALEAKAGLTIPLIFAKYGESYFRDLETQILTEYATNRAPLVLAAGGGVVERPANREILKTVNTYYLKAAPEVLWARLHGPERAHRPLAQNQADFLARFQKRKALYEESGQAVSALAAPLAVANQIAADFFTAPDFTLKALDRLALVRAFTPKSQIFASLFELVKTKRLLVLLDRAFLNEAPLWRSLGPKTLVYIPEDQGEAVKTLRQAEKILTLMAKSGLDRSDYLLAKGGGALTDLGGLCAGLYKRGLNLLLWPTTLLGAVDAAIGGKTAVNLAGAKNQVGLFYIPKETWLEPLTLANNPKNLLAEGLTEALKTGLLFDPLLTRLIEENLDWLLGGDAPLVLAVAQRSAQAKAALVEKDFREDKGLRDVLNLGHTYGHAVESYYGPAVSHGRAVALGLAVALEVSKTLGFDVTLANGLQDLCRRLAGELPKNPPDDEVKRLLTFDKKIRDGRLKFVALNAPGQPEVLTKVEPDLILTAAKTVASRLS